MEVKAISKYVRISPRKLRMIRELVIGKEANFAIQLLENTPKRGARYFIKTIKSALSNAEQKDPGKVWKVKNVIVDQGPAYKRYRAAPMGRAVMVKKRTSHITVILAESGEGEK